VCGICGEITSPGGRADEGLLRRMTRVIAHRGPDDEGFLLEGRAGLGHRRLSIVDLEGGHQPMTSEDGSVWLVCNGEIYNFPDLKEDLIRKGHRFKTRSDNEVIIHLYEEYGEECVKKLRGMFSFALWDARRERLVLGRDRIGQKPMFYALVEGSLIFASEIKALLQDHRLGRRLNPLALHDFLSFKFIPRQEDLFSGVHKLPPASTLVYEKGETRIDRYWELYYRHDEGMTEEEAVGRSDELLREAVRIRLMSDVPLGAFLSSGLDSGLVVGMMSLASEDPVNTFSIGDNIQGFNELPHARLTAERYETNHREFLVEPDAVSILPDLIWNFDGPYADVPSVPMYYVSQIARRYVTVALTGDGGDESFAGYDRYLANYYVNLYRHLPGPIRSRLIPAFLKFFPESTARKSWRQTLRWLNTMSLTPRGEGYAHGISFFSFENDQKEQLYGPEFQEQVRGVNSLEGVLSRYWSDNADDPLDRMTFTDLMVRMPEYSHIKVDRISMMHSLEARSPFMDHKLIEFAATIPPRLKLMKRRRKYILRKLAGSYLPPEILNLTKQGFGSPINRWLREELKGLSHLLLKDSRLVREGFFNQAYIDRLLAEHESSRVNHGYRIWSLVNLETWYRIYFGDRDPESSRENVRDIFGSWSSGSPGRG
jgi:asparagine synthase (glutamine-hydrolysing)